MVRLDKMLSELGLGSRSEIKAKIRGGAVVVNGSPCKDAGKIIDEQKDQVKFCGRVVEYKAVRTLLLNKPSGYVTAARDPKQPTVMDLLPKMYLSSSCMPAGRLDKDTQGLLIITNDGWLAHRIISPSHEVGKVYEAVVDGPLNVDDVDAFARGLSIHDSDGDLEAQSAALSILNTSETESTARVRISEGKYHQVKRMFASRGRNVLFLRRVAIGALKVPDDLELGGYRELSEEEIELLFKESPDEFLMKDHLHCEENVI